MLQQESTKTETTSKRRTFANGLAARQIRALLKEKFPSTSFRVTSEKYRGGSSIEISWEDGPMEGTVEPLVRKYEMGSFDGG